MSDIIEEFLAEFLAQDTKEDGFATLVDGEGHPYVANLNPKEKSRYEETKKPLSQVKKEKKESEKKADTTEKKEEKEDLLKNTGLKVLVPVYTKKEKKPKKRKKQKKAKNQNKRMQNLKNLVLKKS